jgi:hypothetical protein
MIKTEKIDYFNDLSFKMPSLEYVGQGREIMVEKIDLYLNGGIPILSLDEFKSLRNFLPYDIQNELILLSKQVIEEIDTNVINIETDGRLRRYFNKIDEKLNSIIYAIKSISRIEEISANRTYLRPNNLSEGLNDEEKKVIHSIYNLVVIDNFFFYNIYKTVQDHIISLKYENEILEEVNSLDIEHHPDKETLKDENGTLDEVGSVNIEEDITNIETLKGLFKNKEIYDKIITYFIKRKLIKGYKNTIRWVGFQSNRKYDIHAFVIALDEENYLKKMPEKKETIVIARNTFNEFSVSTRALSDNSRIELLVPKYVDVLKDFEDFLNKPFE